MKLFYAPAACSLASHIALEEAGLKYQLAKVDLRTKRLADGSDFRQICPQGYVPALQLKNEQLLTEGPAILQFIADQAPASNLAPVNGSFARYRLQSQLNFLATEIHKSFSPLFDCAVAAATQQAARSKLALRFAQLEAQLAVQNWLVSEYFSVADCYLFTMLLWCERLNIDISAYPALHQYQQKIAIRPAVLAAMRAEQLIA